MRWKRTTKPTVVCNGVAGYRLTFVIGPEGTDMITLMPSESHDVVAGKRVVLWSVESLDDPAIAVEVDAWYQRQRSDDLRKMALDVLDAVRDAAAVREP